MLVSFGLLLTIGAALGAAGLGGVVASELGCVLAPSAVWLAWRRVPAAVVGLDGAWTGRRLLAIVGGLIAGAGAFYLLAAGVESFIEARWPTPPAVADAMRRLLLPPSGARPLVVDLVGLALVPAAAEELLFRGILFGALKPRLGTTGAIVLSAVAFGLFHASPYRLAPATLGGLLLGVVRAASGSLWPAIAFHFANNAGVLVATRLGWERPPPGTLAICVAAAALTGGFLLVVRRRDRA